MYKKDQKDAIARALTACLQDCKNNIEYTEDSEEDYCDVRFQMYEGGQWAFRFGSSDYDQDHRGFWGCSGVTFDTSNKACIDIAYDLIDQAEEQEAEAKTIQKKNELKQLPDQKNNEIRIMINDGIVTMDSSEVDLSGLNIKINILNYDIKEGFIDLFGNEFSFTSL